MDVNTYKHINLSYLEMMSDGDDSMKKIMLEMLLEELPQEIEKMEELCQNSNWPDLSSVSHKLKSTLAFVGNEEMTNKNKKVELYAKELEHLDQIPELVASLKASYPAALEELKQVAESL